MAMHHDLTAALWAVSFGLLVATGGAAPSDRLEKATAPAGDSPVAALWLQDIKTPLGLSAADGMALCQALYAGLRQGTLPATDVSALQGADSPRAVFLSWSDGKTAARVCLGMGATAEEALQSACRRALESKPSPRHLVWLKLDLVQHGEAVTNFNPRDSRLPLPSLIGLSFGPAVGFDFLPEHLLAWDMVSSTGQINVHHVTERVIGEEYGRYLSDTERLRDLGRWTAITSFTGGQKVCLFESQSFFHDGTRCLPLFRGHALYENVSVEELRQAAGAAGDHLAEMCGESGLFECDLPEWELGKPKRAVARDYAVAVMALVRLHQATGEGRYLKAAERAGRCLAAAVRPYGGTPKAGCLPETQILPGPEGVIAEAQITATTTNALTVAALCELSEAAKTEAFHPALALLAQHLVLQLQPDGSVIGTREYPSQALRPAATDTAAAGAALLAFTELYASVAREVFLTHAKAVAGALRRTALAAAEMEALPRDVWLMEGLDRLFTFTRDESLCEPVERLALAGLLDQTRDVDFPDGYGAVADQPSALPAADRSRLMAVGARLLHDMGRTAGTDTLLGEARPFVLFQMQTRITPADALYLSAPPRYLGLFRDHVLDVGLELRGQAAQILSLLALAREMERLGRNNLPEDLAVQKSLGAARDLAGRWPRYLTPAVAGTAQAEPGRAVEFRNAAREMLTIRPRSPEDAKGTKGAKGRKTSPFVPVQPVKR